MSQDLFPIEGMPSPKLQWKERHGIVCEPTSDGKWKATNATISATAVSEEEALLDLAGKLNIHGWREERYAVNHN